MLKKLKIKFVLITMALLFAVLAVFVAGICVTTQRKLNSDGETQMRRAANEDKLSVEIGRPGRPAIYGVFNVEILSDGSTALYSGGANVDEETIAALVEAALTSGSSEGRLKGQGFDYLVTATRYGTLRVTFRDLTSDRAVMTNLIRTLLLAGLLALALFFLISLFLARRAIKPVEESWEKQRRFVADASHELKNPLAVIRANCGLVLSHPEETVDSQKKWLGYIGDETERLDSLAEDLLFLARSDAGGGQIEKKELNLSDLVWGCVLPFEPVAFEQKRTLVSEIAPDVVLRGDAARLRRLVMVLLDNACKHSDEGSVISLRLTKTEGTARIAVKNSGEVIPPAEQERIFDRFYRPDEARSREKGGAGLGLAIAKAVAEEHGGKIAVTSRERDGTEFTATLPLA